MAIEKSNASNPSNSTPAPDVRIGIASLPFVGLLAVLQRVLNTPLPFHSWISYPDAMWGGRWIVNADSHGVRAMPESAMPAMAKPDLEYRCKVDLSLAMQKCRGYVGRPYDFASLFVGHPLRVAAYYLTGVEFLNPVRDASRFTCSEFVATVFKAAALPDTELMDPETETPASLVQYMDRHPQLFEQIVA